MKTKHIPMRMCAICRQRFPKEALKRYVVKDNKAFSDEKKTMPGRGTYLCNSEDCLKKWMKRVN